MVTANIVANIGHCPFKRGLKAPNSAQNLWNIRWIEEVLMDKQRIEVTGIPLAAMIRGKWVEAMEGRPCGCRRREACRRNVGCRPREGGRGERVAGEAEFGLGDADHALPA